MKTKGYLYMIESSHIARSLHCFMVGYHLDDLQTLFLLFIKKKKKLDSMFFLHWGIL